MYTIKTICLLLLALSTSTFAIPSGNDKKKSGSWDGHDSKKCNDKNSEGISDCIISCLDQYNLRAHTSIGAIVSAVCSYPKEYFDKDGQWKKAEQPLEFGYCEKKCPDAQQVVGLLSYMRNSNLCDGSASTTTDAYTTATTETATYEALTTTIAGTVFADFEPTTTTEDASATVTAEAITTQEPAELFWSATDAPMPTLLA